MTKPRVSLVMPTKGRTQFITKTVQSLLDQSYPDFELLVRDDGDGNDGKQSVVAAFQDPRIHYHLNVGTHGIPDSTNAGILDCRGEYIGVVHDHDLFHPTYLEKMVAALDSAPSANYVHCGIQMIDQDDSPLSTHIGNWSTVTKGRDWLAFMLSSLNCPVCAINLVRRDAYEKFGTYDRAFGFVADIEMWMRLASKGDVAYINEPLILVRTREADHAANDTANKILKIVGKIHAKYIPILFEGSSARRKQLLNSLRVNLQLVRNSLSIIKSKLVGRTQSR